MLLVAGLVACDNEKPGPAETAGKNFDQSIDNAGKQMEKAGDKVAEKMAEQTEKTEVAIEDTEITAKVKAAIFAEHDLKTLQISVDTVKGVVTLSGSVDTQSNSDTARSLAAALAGVNRVENRLVVLPAK
ncbi:MAG: BON domain-containing protein [Gallionella sp.]|nr:BON domain-containing protein [Gallionella sp.]